MHTRLISPMPTRLLGTLLMGLLFTLFCACQSQTTGTDNWQRPDFSTISSEDFNSNEFKRDSLLWAAYSVNGRTIVNATPAYWEKYGVTALAIDGTRYLPFPLPKVVLPSSVGGDSLTSIPDGTGHASMDTYYHGKYGKAVNVSYHFSHRKPLTLGELGDYTTLCAQPFTETQLATPRQEVFVIDQQVRAFTPDEAQTYKVASRYKIYPKHECTLLINGFLSIHLAFDTQLPKEQRVKLRDEFLSKINYEAAVQGMTLVKK